ncbi:RNA 3'-terminal phosphate cyclase-domain-containing protein [Podospora appendiculata]|uniref:RNA 3'-terminal phosphate cyclase-domain-containing protein n=1 Tax=Podospora appendiculata TaxID=314037 RepID=A0AAE0XHS6_9PEZI|nr:RNA 3'-terminal phosphate cyclase-domain-containing protein [Podospora appendiculata]
MKEPKPTEIDGRTGEGGGQLVRIACALAAVAGRPIKITNVRGNRGGGPRGGDGGLKSQHVSAIKWLAEATAADVSGLSIGSHTLEFRPRLRPSQLRDRAVNIAADSAAASTLLIFQAILPFLLFAGNGSGSEQAPIEVEITGGTNVAFSLSYEYLDQVLLPTLEAFFVGVRVDRRLAARGWSQGRAQRGRLQLTVHPLRAGEALRLRDPERVFGPEDFEIVAVDVSVVVPWEMQTSLTRALAQDLEDLFPGAEVCFRTVEDSGAESRIYVLLVARSATLRWGRDVLTSTPKKAKGKASSVSDSVSRKVSKELYEEVSRGGVVDEYLQDQLVVFQALAKGRSSFPCSDGDDDDDDDDDGGGAGGGEEGLEDAIEALSIEKRMRRDKAGEPFGEGSTHTATARWVTTELLPDVAWYNKGLVCEGVGIQMDKP